MLNTNHHIPFALCFALFVTGCSTSPTTSDLMRDHAAELSDQVILKRQIAKDWDTGNKMIIDGEKAVKRADRAVRRAERELSRAQADLENAQNQISEGAQLKFDSEQRFRTHFPDDSLSL
ncbi:hypothetical protein [Halopseudomonas salina]|uniref:Lipoprotein n=1 Tax=Halopseudomonas salina TaxID=1323744 RepID=A0ABQ1P6Y9_9GAMM|nr:hypothetical protein [Halopseudomonas salina]GGC91346.1 hypothetical protein GCM10007418_08790 [Halopseudomonas salina]